MGKKEDFTARITQIFHESKTAFYSLKKGVIVHYTIAGESYPLHLRRHGRGRRVEGRSGLAAEF